MPGERALDVGCGTGIYTAWLAARGLDVMGLDREPSMLAAARAKAPGARFVEGDVAALPFEDAEFDLVLAVTLFCFLMRSSGGRPRASCCALLAPAAGRGRRARPLQPLGGAPRLKGWRGSGAGARPFHDAGELRRLFSRAGGPP